MPPLTRKRKHSEEEPAASMKFYAVRKGKKPGVFTSWDDCQEQITGFGGAMFKKFDTEADAEAFVAGRNPAKVSAEDKFYGVAVGKTPGVYTEWVDAKEQIDGVKGPKYKKFATREEAEAFVESGGKFPKKQKIAEPDAKVATNDTKKQETFNIKPKPTKPIIKADTVKVWTDGSSRGNGKKGARAGVGVFFGDGDKRNLSEPLVGEPQTNQRAELTAALRALEIVPYDKHIEIVTDSRYTIQCATEWYESWEINNWKTSTGDDVKNQDLVASIRKIIDERTAKGLETNMTWVKGHNADPGNSGADNLAVKGAMADRD